MTYKLPVSLGVQPRKLKYSIFKSGVIEIILCSVRYLLYDFTHNCGLCIL